MAKHPAAHQDKKNPFAAAAKLFTKKKKARRRKR